MFHTGDEFEKRARLHRHQAIRALFGLLLGGKMEALQNRSASKAVTKTTEHACPPTQNEAA
ncbi:hypothetical protein [uncultured Roseibium sp.]|uniref:hypothetical protein n=1 Tax=uncultured Roseibium sp. TaxID=1936171 RepID=UPI002595BCD6|nr:hypothetical protein [uncultured Roseibium sp.]